MGDLISRQELIDRCDDVIENGIPTDSGLHPIAVEAVKYVVENMPSEQQWIPCNERLPSGQENVIVTIYDDHGDTPWEYTTNAWHIDGVWIADNDIVCGSVLAWMPLQQPWEEVEDG